MNPSGPKPPRTPAEEAAGNRRALIGCGLILLIITGAIVGLLLWYRSTGLGPGEVCEVDGEQQRCKGGHLCVGDAFKAVKPVCRKTCDSNEDCEVGRCTAMLRDAGKVCQ